MKTPNPAKISKTAKSTCGRAETIVGSVGDLLVQIFVHLPLKPLFRFKSVSKHWNSIISDPRFQFLLVKEHNNNRAVGLIFQNFYNRNDTKPVETRLVSFDTTTNPLPQKVLPNTLRILHSCNGLLVLKNTDVFAKPEYYVYNHTTKQKSTNLLKDDVIKAWPLDRVVGMCLAFDPSKSPHYKVVCVWELVWTANCSLQYQFEVYSSETGSWEIRGGYNGYVDFMNNGVYWNGAIHWFRLPGESIYFNPDHDERPRVMPDPPETPFSRRYYFGESCDHLHFAVVDDRHFNVYEMRRDYSEWFLLYKFDYSSQLMQNTCFKVRHFFCVVRGNKDEDSFLVFGTNHGEIVCYNLVHNTFHTIPVKYFDFDGYVTKSYQYIESPCSV